MTPQGERLRCGKSVSLGQCHRWPGMVWPLVSKAPADVPIVQWEGAKGQLSLIPGAPAGVPGPAVVRAERQRSGEAAQQAWLAWLGCCAHGSTWLSPPRTAGFSSPAPYLVHSKCSAYDSCSDHVICLGSPRCGAVGPGLSSCPSHTPALPSCGLATFSLGLHRPLREVGRAEG